MYCACRLRPCRNPRKGWSRRRCARPACSINRLYSWREAMKVWQIGMYGVVLASLVGCNSFGLGSKRIDYSAGAAQVPALEVPPDLTTPASDERYRVPQGNDEGVATYSDYSKGNAAAQGHSAGAVLPREAEPAVAAVAANSVVAISASGPAGTASLEEI